MASACPKQFEQIRAVPREPALAQYQYRVGSRWFPDDWGMGERAMSIQSAENSPAGPMLGEVRIRFLLCFGVLLAGAAFCVAGASRMDADALGGLGIVT